MKLETQVCSLELAKRLKKLGVKQESLFYWDNHNYGWRIEYVGMACPIHNSFGGGSAFTVAELGEMLELDEMEIRTEKGGSGDYYLAMEAGGGGVQFVADTEANARAKCLIYLLEQGIIKL